MAASLHSVPQVPGVVGLRVVVVVEAVVVVVVDVVVSGVVVSDGPVVEAVEVDARRALRSILFAIGGSSEGQPENSVVDLTLEKSTILRYRFGNLNEKVG